MIAAPVLCFFRRPSVWVLAMLMVPMIADGLIQLKTAYESTNPRRFVTGVLFGYGLMTLFITSIVATVLLGYQFGQQIL